MDQPDQENADPGAKCPSCLATTPLAAILHRKLVLARELELPLPICTQIERLWLRGVALGWGDDDMTGLIRLFEEPAGVQVQVSERPR